jgi:hypothetical protein
MSKEDETSFSFGQMLAMREIDRSVNGMLNYGLSSAHSCRIIAKAVDDDALPLNSAHFRAAGLHFLEGVEQLIKGVDEDGDVEEQVKDLRKEIEECRAELIN